MDCEIEKFEKSLKNLGLDEKTIEGIFIFLNDKKTDVINIEEAQRVVEVLNDAYPLVNSASLTLNEFVGYYFQPLFEEAV